MPKQFEVSDLAGSVYRMMQQEDVSSGIAPNHVNDVLNMAERVKAEQKSLNCLSVAVEVDTSELDAAIDKAKELTERVNQLQDKPENQLLVIELDDIHSAPRVIYKGKEVTMITSANLDWTANDEDIQPKSFHIQHFDKEDRCIKGFGYSK